MSNLSLTRNRNFRENFIKQFRNGQKLLEDLDEFVSQARQIIICNKRRQKEEKITSKKRKEEELEDERNSLAEDEMEESSESIDAVEQKRQKALAAAIDSSKSMTIKPLIEQEEAKMEKKAERRMEKAKRRILGSRMVRELRRELEDRPEEVRGDEPETTIFSSFDFSRKAEARRRYEETHFVRLGQSREERKAEKMRRHQSLAGNQLERELLTFGQYRLPGTGSDEAEQHDHKPNGRRKGAGGNFGRNKRGTKPMKNLGGDGFKKKKPSHGRFKVGGKGRSKRGDKKR